MKWPKGYSLEEAVHWIVNEVGKTVLSLNPEVVIPLPRRAGRILDLFLDSELKEKLKPLIVYPTVVRYSPNELTGKYAVLIDDCVQRGINSKKAYANLTPLVKSLDVFAIAKCNWHQQNGQFSGIRIREPFIECFPEEFEIVTSYINDSLLSCPLPLDYEDALIRINLDSKTKFEKLIEVLQTLGHVGKVLAHQESQVQRLSCFFSDSAPILSGLIPEEGSLLKDIESKVCLSIGSDGEVFMVPLLLYQYIKPEGEPSIQAEFLKIMSPFIKCFPDDVEEDWVYFEAAHVAANSVLSGRLLKYLNENGIACNFDISPTEFLRYYGRSLGIKLAQLYKEVMDAESKSWRFGRTERRPTGEFIIQSFNRYLEIAEPVREVLDNLYVTHNKNVRPRVEWESVGLTFSHIETSLQNKGISTSPSEISLVLDGELASCWLRTDCGIIQYPKTRHNTLSTLYQRTEQEYDINPDVDLNSFARPPNHKTRLSNSKDFIGLTVQTLRTVSSQESIHYGHWLHFGRIVLEVMGSKQKETLFVPQRAAHGEILELTADTAYSARPMPVDFLKERLGIVFERKEKDTYNSTIRCENSILKDTRFNFDLRALLPSFETLLQTWQKHKESVARGGVFDILVFLSSCCSTLRSLGNIHFGLIELGKRFEKMMAAKRFANETIDSCGHYLGGASNKIRLASQSSTITKIVKDIKFGLQPPLAVEEFISGLEGNQIQNLCFMIFKELAEESACLLDHIRKVGQSQGTLFDIQQVDSVGLIGGKEIENWLKELRELILETGRLSDYNYSYQDEKVQREIMKVSQQIRGNLLKHEAQIENLIFVSIDTFHSQQKESEKVMRFKHDWPLWRSLAAFYHGFEPRPPAGDSIYFCFKPGMNYLRFIISVLLTMRWSELVSRYYRIIAYSGKAEFQSDGNIYSSALNLIGSIEDFSRQRENQVPEAQGSLALPSGLLPPHYRQLIERLSRDLRLGELKVEEFRPKANIVVELTYSVFLQTPSS